MTATTRQSSMYRSGVIVLVVLAIIAVGLFVLRKQPQRGPDATVRLDWASREVVVENVGEKQWVKLTVCLDNPPEYYYSCPAPGVGKSVKIGLEQFTNDTGKPYRMDRDPDFVWVGGDNFAYEQHALNRKPTP